MSVLQSIRQFFASSTDQPDGLDVLASLLAEREATLALDAEYVKPTVNMTGEPTAVFPITLRHESENYGGHAKEFAVPDNGLDDVNAPLTQFLADAHDKATSNVEFADIATVEGMTADARLNDDGEVTVDVPSNEVSI